VDVRQCLLSVAVTVVKTVVSMVLSGPPSRGPTVVAPTGPPILAAPPAIMSRDRLAVARIRQMMCRLDRQPRRCTPRCGTCRTVHPSVGPPQMQRHPVSRRGLGRHLIGCIQVAMPMPVTMYHIGRTRCGSWSTRSVEGGPDEGDASWRGVRFLGVDAVGGSDRCLIHRMGRAA